MDWGRISPWRASAYLVHLVGFFFRPSRIRPRTIWNSGLSVEAGSGRVPSLAYAFSALAPSAQEDRYMFTTRIRVAHYGWEGMDRKGSGKNVISTIRWTQQ